jgi:hypothetical protein
MQHQTPQEFYGIECQGAQAVAMRVVLVAEGHLAVLQGHETMVSNGHTVGIAGQILQDVPGALEGLFGVDHPLFVAHSGEEPLPGLGLGEVPTAPRQGQLALAIELLQSCKVQSPKTTREDADGQEEVGTTRHPTGAIQRYPPGGQDTMERRMMVQLLAPGVEHGQAPDLSAQMRGVSSDVLEGLGDGMKEQPIEEARVLKR